MWRGRTRLDRAVATGTWSALTNGKITTRFEGPLLAFWATGRICAGQWPTSTPSIYVVLDEKVMVLVDFARWPDDSGMTILQKDSEQPTVVVSSGTQGARITEARTGFEIERRNQSIDKVRTDFHRRSWRVEARSGP